jgi:hypothetical protein
LTELVGQELAGQRPFIGWKSTSACFFVSHMGRGERFADAVVQPSDEIGVDAVALPWASRSATAVMTRPPRVGSCSG